ncbi:MAG: CotH kinase family protein, partial [Planctomycetes bacterium]|nr:CotH kinase family protein [Planctomycetota bacterium]
MESMPLPQAQRAAAFEPLEPRLLLAGTLVISEFLAVNNNSITDQDGEHSDWVELRNTGATTMNLVGWHLTDDPLNPTKWTLPNMTLKANEYLVVFASGKDRAQSGQELHTNFQLDGDGEYLALVMPDGTTRTSEYAPEFPEQRADISFADGLYYLAPTPRKVNGTPVVGFVSDTHFSIDRGFYDAPFDVALTCNTPGAAIYYTTDGSAPTPAAGFLYTGGVHVETTTTLRAAAFLDGYAPSNVDTQTYIFLDDVIAQTGAGLPQTWGKYVYENAGQSVPANYAMDAGVVAQYNTTIRDDLRSIPTMSIVCDPDDLWDAQTGIYANPLSEGVAWERAASIEYIGTDGQTLFQIDAGLRIQGGWGRRPSQNLKHSVRLLFKDDYGPTKLEYPLFGEGADDAFDTIILRAGFNDSWAPGGSTGATYLQDRWTGDTQNAMGGYAPHGTYVHLYINGLYWGLYNPVERPNADFAASYFGGQKEEYDAYVTGELIDGNATAWNQLLSLVRQGSINFAAVSDAIDMTNFIDYLIVNQFGGNWDWPHNNWYATHQRGEGGKWYFHSWDAEGCLSDPNANRVYSYGNNGPGEIYQRLLTVPEFRLLFADRVQKHLFNDGLLTPAANLARINARAAEIDRAIVGESARWGDGRLSQVSPDRTRDDWVARINWLRTSYFPQRTNTMIVQYRAAGLYPSLAAPTYNHNTGQIPAGFSLTMTAPEGTIYYTLDGTDPRQADGQPAPWALVYSAPIPLALNTVVKARTLKGTTWSAVNEVTLVLDTLPTLRITEI